MVKRGWEVNGSSLSGLEMRWAAIWTVTQVSWQLWIMPLRAMDGFSGKDRSNATIETPWLTLTNQLSASPHAPSTSFRHALDPSPYSSSSLTNFYRVFVVPDFWFDLNGVLLSGGPKSPGEDFIPIYYGA